ncbi:MAG: glycosyltransferase [Actinomycetota bacterium]
MPVTILAPAFNEEAVIEAFVEALSAVLHPNWCLLVVDDGSVDRTPELLGQLAERVPRLRVVTHPYNRGLGSALATGFKEARRGVVITMDADLSHPLDLLDSLVAGCSNTDAVFASRYVPGGGMVGVPAGRVIVSKLANTFLRLIFRTKVRDLTTGFRAYRTDRIDLARVDADRFDAQLEISIRLIAAGRRIDEIPLILGTRQAGESKMDYRRLIKPYGRTVIKMLALRWAGVGR